MEAGGFAEGEVFGLRAERGDVVVVVEEERHEDSHGEGDEDPFGGEGPEGDEPGAVDGGVEGAGVGDAEEGGGFEAAGDVGEAGPENGGDGVGVVGEEAAQPGAEDDGAGDEFEAVDGEPVAEGYYDAKVARGQAAVVELVDEFFDAFDCEEG